MASMENTTADELRAKYSDDDRKAMAKSGQAMSDGAYPIKDAEDLANAIKAVGLGNASDTSIRQHIIARAKALGLSDQLPESWKADGSKKEENSQTPLAMRRKPRHRSVPRNREVRHFAPEGLEVRASSDSDEIVITGCPIVYDTPYTVVDPFGEFEERMLAGVAQNVLRGDTRFLFNHDGMPLARTISGTLQLRDTGRGLDFVARLDSRQQLANDLAIAIERGDVSQMSCGFIVAEDDWNDSMDQRSIRLLAEMPDVSAVTYAASPTTSIEVVRSIAMAMPEVARARVDKLYAEIRAGKVLSQGNQDKIVNAVTTLHEVLDGAGFDPEQVGNADNELPEDQNADGAEEATEAEGTQAEPVVDEPIYSVGVQRNLALELELLARVRH